MASNPITSQQIDGENVETVSDFICLGSKVNVDGDCSHKIKRRLLLGRIAMSNLDSVLKSRHITLPTKVHIIKAMVFPVVMYGCESLTIKKAEQQRIDAFELWCWKRCLRVPWTARRSMPKSLSLFLAEMGPTDIDICHFVSPGPVPTLSQTFQSEFTAICNPPCPFPAPCQIQQAKEL